MVGKQGKKKTTNCESNKQLKSLAKPRRNQETKQAKVLNWDKHPKVVCNTRTYSYPTNLQLGSITCRMPATRSPENFAHLQKKINRPTADFGESLSFSKSVCEFCISSTKFRLWVQRVQRKILHKVYWSSAIFKISNLAKKKNV